MLPHAGREAYPSAGLPGAAARSEGGASALNLFAWHFMAWPDLPDDFDERYESAWITAPNALYDPVRGTQVTSEYIEQLRHAEDLGFDGVVLNEHHQNAYGMMPAPNLIAAALSRLTSRVKIVVLGNLLGFHLNPLRVAEEYAMLDVMSGGRVVAGLAVGMAAEFFSYNNNPMFIRERFWEGVDIVVKAWTERGPVPYKGKHFSVPYVNIWPRPVQQPAPEIWIPGAVSQETMREVARRGLGYFLSSRQGVEHQKRVTAGFRDVLAREGAPYSPYRMGLLLTVYVGETDAAAREESEEAIWYFLRRNLLGHLRRKGRALTTIPYPTSLASYQSYFERQQWERGLLGDARDWDELQRFGSVIVGGPETVARELAAFVRECQVGNLLIQFQFGNLSHEKATRNMDRFAERVMPRLREEGDAELCRRFGPEPEAIAWRGVTA